MDNPYEEINPYKGEGGFTNLAPNDNGVTNLGQSGLTDSSQGPGDGSYGGGGNSGPNYGVNWPGEPGENDTKAANNLAGITGYNQDTILGAAQNADKMYDVSDQQNKFMQELQAIQAKRNAGNDWYTQQQRLQSVTANLREQMGNALYGSTLYDFWDLLARKDDMDDVEVLNTLRENLNNTDNAYWEAIMATNNARNEMYLETEQNLRELAADYAAQVNNIHPALAEGLISGDMGSGGTINVPSWLQTEYFNSHMRGPIHPTEQELFRPEKAAKDAWSKGLLNGNHNANSATNQSYWQRMFGGYNRRTQ